MPPRPAAVALAWLVATWWHAHRGALLPRDATVLTILLLAAAVLLGLEAGAAARQSSVADGRLIAMVISLVLAAASAGVAIPEQRAFLGKPAVAICCGATGWGIRYPRPVLPVDGIDALLDAAS